MKRIVQVTPLAGHQLRLVFDDGVEGVADVSDLVGRGVFSALVDDRAFQAVAVGTSGELLWTNGLDLCADALYLRVTGKTAADVFPALEREARIA
jgi:hypothetical protein